MRIEPTHAQAAVLACVREFWSRHGFAPAVRDIADAIDRSISTVQYHLDRLEDRGWIERDRNVARSIRITTEGRSSYEIT